MASVVVANETCEDGAADATVCPSTFHSALEVLPSLEVAAVADERMDINMASISTNQYYSARTQWMIENRDKFPSQVEFEIECSKVHRTFVQHGRGSVEEREGRGEEEDTDKEEDERDLDEEEDERELDEEILEANKETITELRKHRVWWNRFREDRDGVYEIRGKIGEGGEAHIYAGIRADQEKDAWDRHVVFKVYRRGCYLRDLVKQWPENCSEVYVPGLAINIVHVMLMPNDGRIAMVMRREWGDLRRFIDLKKQANNNQGPPFDIHTIVTYMRSIAFSMRILHHLDVVHRDLKASNILVHASHDCQTAWESNVADIELPLPVELGDSNNLEVSDLECALGVMGTRFWRAPEVLLGIREWSSTTLFTKASDVYSYGMLCYEIATGFLPFERERYNGTKADQDRVISGSRPTFPDDVDDRVKGLIMRCWLQDASQRPTFEKIGMELQSIYESIFNLVKKVD